MATRRNPRFKECRRLGANVCGHPKAMDRAGIGDGKRRKKISDYGIQLTEKQKVKAYYGILERQLVRYYRAAEKAQEKTGTALLQLLECRLDNLVYRIGLANSIRMARQMVTHGHVRVDGRKMNIPSFGVGVGSMITLRDKSRDNAHFRDHFLEGGGFPVEYLRRSQEDFGGALIRLPRREEIPVDVNDRLVVEYYTR